MWGERSDRRSGDRGLSLVEVMMALVVVAVGLFGLLDLMGVSRRHAVRAERRAVANELACAKMAEIRAAGFDAVAALLPSISDDPSSPTSYPPAPARFVSPYKSARYLWQAGFSRLKGPLDVLNVEVRVFWYPTTAAPATQIEEHSVALGGLLVRKRGNR